jgi:type II secretory ATPase GspE/PulE/Tfp pilus assembly ATPase PilB-like protein
LQGTFWSARSQSFDAIKNNVLTAESPIEVFLENISQTQVDDDGPYSFAM